MTSTVTERGIYRLFMLAVILIVLYAIALVVREMTFITRTDVIASAMLYQLVAPLMEMLARYAILSGLIGGMVWVLSMQHDDAHIADEGLFETVRRGWVALVVASVLVRVFLYGGGWQFILIIDIATIVLLMMVAFIAIRSDPRKNAVVLVWLAGILLYISAMLINLFNITRLVPVDFLFTISRLDMNETGIVLAGLAVIHAVLQRISTVTPARITFSLYTSAGLVVLAGAAGVIPRLFMFIPSSTLTVLTWIGAVLSVVCWLVVLAQAYPILSNRNTMHTLAGHWVVLALVAWSLGAVVRAVWMLPPLFPYLGSTFVASIPGLLTLSGGIAAACAVINQAVAEMRAKNRRITTPLPFWLTAFGMLGGILMFVISGVVQGYLERTVEVGYLETQALLTVPFTVWIVGCGVVVLGVVLYAMGLWSWRLQDEEAWQ